MSKTRATDAALPGPIVSTSSPTSFVIPPSTIETFDVFYTGNGKHRGLPPLSRSATLVMVTCVDLEGAVVVNLGANVVTFEAPGKGVVKSASMKGIRTLHAGETITVVSEGLKAETSLRLYVKYEN